MVSSLFYILAEEICGIRRDELLVRERTARNGLGFPSLWQIYKKVEEVPAVHDCGDFLQIILICALRNLDPCAV